MKCSSKESASNKKLRNHEHTLDMKGNGAELHLKNGPLGDQYRRDQQQKQSETCTTAMKQQSITGR